MIIKEETGFKDIAAEWSDAHKFSPAPRHRRRILLDILKKINYESCLDAGCAQPYLLEVLCGQNKQVFGCDISDKVIEVNRKRFPQAGFEVVDISKQTYPLSKKFDLVISSEVLEHIEDWRAGLRNLTLMSGRFLLITIPTGKIHKMDQLVGHIRHYTYEELKKEIEKNNFRVVFHKYWGMPFHTLYKYLINTFDYRKTYKHFAVQNYGVIKKIFSQILYLLFYFNDIFKSGSQLFILTQKIN